MTKRCAKIHKKKIEKNSIPEGGQLKSHVCPQGGGGSKMAKNLSTWFMNDPQGKN